ncbi:MAG: MvaI/BcnI family restriction endonuclease [Verrucomicrobia bacterium]|nr:MvaI/BcnI family restriction endonuclease [Verrucomicrobiota bacterium]
MNLDQLKDLFVAGGCTRLFAKVLAENDNSKNQVYFAGDVGALNVFPSRQIFAENTKRGPSFKSLLDFSWLLPNGQTAAVPGAQLILYAQYPEVRFSGFLKGCKQAPSDLMAARIDKRVLFLGVTNDRRVLGFVVGPDSEVAKEVRATNLQPTKGVFIEWGLPNVPAAADARLRLLAELRIHHLGWIDSKQLDSTGRVKPCKAPQCGGFTLEAELGISKNSSSKPDYLGWEVKQFAVRNFERFELSSPITMMTPEPTAGYYKERSVPDFVRRFGYVDKTGRQNRMNFGGRHFVDLRCESTGLTLRLQGFDSESGKITDACGQLVLVSVSGEVAAAWSFEKVLEHWAAKHTKAVYVPSKLLSEPKIQYSYGHTVRLAEGTDSLFFLKALATGHIFYDPGIKLEQTAVGREKFKARSQFRVASKNINALYRNVESLDLR